MKVSQESLRNLAQQSYHLSKREITLIINQAKKSTQSVFQWHKKYMLETFLAIVLVFVLSLGILTGVVFFKIKNTSDIKGLDDYNLYEVPSVLYDIKGRPFKKFSISKRKLVPYEQIPPSVINTLLLSEDRDFFNHKGINPIGILRALVVDILSGHVKQGGSTLTQQLAKLMFTNRERSITRKLKELIYALQIEKHFTKEEILEKYLNKVYYANGVYGIETASEYYFDKPVSKLNYAQAALLVAIPPSPRYFNPLSHPLNAKRRQQVIMGLLIDHQKISKQEAERLTDEMWGQIEIKLVNGGYRDGSKEEDQAPYFSEYIRRILYKKYGKALYTNGYQIYTTLNLDLQKQAQKSLKKNISRTRKEYSAAAKHYYKYIKETVSVNNIADNHLSEFLGVALGTPYLHFYLGSLEDQTKKDLFDEDIYALKLVFGQFHQTGINKMVDKSIDDNSHFNITTNQIEGAIISTEVSTGRILSMMGGEHFSGGNQLNRIYQARRQPGSAFKPFLYLAALNSEKFTAAHTFNDNPIAFTMTDGSLWMPGNSEKNYAGEITLRGALKHSLNIVSIKLLQALGIKDAIHFVSDFLEVSPKRFQYNASLALGTNELTPLELNKGFATIANGGKRVIPHALIEVRDRYNNIIYKPESKILVQEQTQLDDPRYNYILIDMLKDVMRSGTGATRANIMGFHPGNIAAKTGTTSNMADAWFSGFSPDVATTVWVGFDRRASLGRNGFGGVLAEPIWIEYMNKAMKEYKYRDFEAPEGVIPMMVNKENGLLMKDECEGSGYAYREFFTRETLPTKYSAYCGRKLDVELEKNEEEIDDADIFTSKF